MKYNEDMKNKTEDIKATGFFGGASELAEYLVEEGAKREREKIESMQKLTEIDGQTYKWDANEETWTPVAPYEFIPNDPPFPNTLGFFTLDGFIDYIVENVEGLIPSKPEKPLMVIVQEPTVVLLESHPTEHQKLRHIIARCAAHCPQIHFGRWLDTETFNTQLLSKFIETDARAALFKVIKSMTKEQGCNTTDDGVSQVITVKQGVTMASNVAFQNPVPLKPIRTFCEVEQPESNFTLRVNENAECALFEADGGAWQNEAVLRIRDYLRSKLKGQNVVVIA